MVGFSPSNYVLNSSNIMVVQYYKKQNIKAIKLCILVAKKFTILKLPTTMMMIFVRHLYCVVFLMSSGLTGAQADPLNNNASSCNGQTYVDVTTISVFIHSRIH